MPRQPLQRLRFSSRGLRCVGARMNLPFTLREVPMKRNPFAIALVSLALALPTIAAVSSAAPTTPKQDDESKYQYLKDAANAMVAVQVKAIGNARSAATLGVDRIGAGVVIDKDGLVLTIGYLILQADHVDILTTEGRTVPAMVAAYDHATGFGLLRPLVPIDVK